MTWHQEETYKGLIQLSQRGLRFGPVINGGGAVALLALLGNLYGKGAAIDGFELPMICYITGIGLSGFAYITSYLTQLFLYNEGLAQNEPATKITHTKWLNVTLILIMLSIVTFCAGSYLGVSALSATSSGGI
mgnify:CR=1 FL=1